MSRTVMDVDREFAEMLRRVQASIDRSAREALIRIGVDVEAEERAAALAAQKRQEDAMRQAVYAKWEGIGAAVRMMAIQWSAMIDGLTRGFSGDSR